MKIKREAVRLAARRLRERLIISANDLTVERGDGAVVLTMQWPDVKTVHAMNMDLVTTDRLSLAFGTVGGELVDAHEDMDGWTDLVEQLPRLLPGCESFEQWGPCVTLPSFGLNARRIYATED